MTTIAADLESMAADTRRTGDVIASVTKLKRFGTSIFGVCGDMTLIVPFWAWAEGGFKAKSKPTLPEGSFEALELAIDGLWEWDRCLFRHQLNDEFHAIGTGGMAAKTAIFLGKTPEEAIEVASEFDECTGPPIQVEFLKPKRKR